MAMGVENQLWNSHINRFMNFKKLDQSSNYDHGKLREPRIAER